MSDHPVSLTDEELTYVTRPTAWTVFMRTFVPWQVWRFLRINLKMVDMILHRPERRPRS
ncbi:MAG TPA: hypothetical protein VFN50_01360 [Acidimicrobiales bacterium]|nr:hypothetical protein [Acidimicrobiales bacterium]